MKNVLITGGAGFIGSHLTNRLLDEGYHVHLVDNFARAVKDDEYKAMLERDNVKFSCIDLLDESSIDSLGADFDVIFHLAAIIGVTHVMEQPYKVLYDNIRMLGNMIDLAHKQKNLSRFLFASTSEVYAGTLKYFDLAIPTPVNTPLAITDLSHPRTSYMLSKIYGEALCQQSGLPFTIFRPHNVYGPRMGMAHVVPEQLRKAYNAQDGDSIDVFSVDHTRCFCYIDDAVEMLLRIIERTECEGKTLNLGTEQPEVTMRQLAIACFSELGKDLSINVKPASSGSPARRGPDMRYTTELTDYESKITLQDGIGRTFQWYKANVFEKDGLTAK